MRARNYRVADTRGEEGITIRGRFCYEIAAHRAACAGPVLDDHLLVQMLAEFLREYARGDVQAAGGRETHDDAHRLYGIGLRRRMLQRRDRYRRANDRDEGTVHRRPGYLASCSSLS